MASEGVGIAAAVVTSRFGAADAPASHVLSQTSSLLEDLLRSARLTSFHLGVADEEAQFPMANTPGAEVKQGGAQYVLLVEALNAHALDLAMGDLLPAIHERLQPSQRPIAKTFELDIIVDRSRLAHATTRRQPPRPDLRARWC